MLRVRDCHRADARTPLTNEVLQPRRVHGVLGKRVLGVDNRERAVLLERRGVVAELVQEYAESPDVCDQ